MDVGIVAQKGNRQAASLAADLRERLSGRDVRVGFDEATAAEFDVDGVSLDRFIGFDLVVSIGGDGTFLLAARGAQDTPMLGVNLGEVGFLNAIPPEEAIETATELVEAFHADELVTRDLPRIAAHGDGWHGDSAVNEVVVQGARRGHGGGIDVEVSVDGGVYSTSHADGVLVSTPTGSTAYNLSEGGPLVHPLIDGLVVTEMAAETGMPPLVVPPDGTVTVSVSGDEDAVVVSDGRTTQTLSPPAEVNVVRTGPPVRVAGPPADFFEALEKLD